MGWFSDWLFQIDRRRQERRRQERERLRVAIQEDADANARFALQMQRLQDQMARLNNLQNTNTNFGVATWLVDPEYEANQRSALLKSKELLDSYLTEVERKQFEAKKYITVKGKNLTYKITHDAQVSIPKMGTFCVHVKGGVPVYDKILAYKLHIENNEDGFLKEANFTSKKGDIQLGKIDNTGKVVPRAKRDGPLHLGWHDYYGWTTAERLRDLMDTDRDLGRDPATARQRNPRPINQIRNGLTATTTTITRNTGGFVAPGPTGTVTLRRRTEPLEVTAFGDTRRTYLTDAMFTWHDIEA